MGFLFYLVVLSNFEAVVFVSCYFILFCIFFLIRDRKRRDRKGGGRELGGVERRERIIGIYYVRKESFSMKGKSSMKVSMLDTVSGHHGT